MELRRRIRSRHTGTMRDGNASDKQNQRRQRGHLPVTFQILSLILGALTFKQAYMCRARQKVAL